MLKKLQLIFALVFVGGLVVLGSPRPSLAVDITNPVCNNPNINPKPSVCPDPTEATSDKTFFGSDGLFVKVLNILSIVGAVAAVITIIVAGLRMIFSAGDSNTVANSRQAIIYACIGLVIIAFAQAIIQLIINKVS